VSWMMVPVPLQKHLDGHAEIASSLPHVSASLHEPRRCSVAQMVPIVPVGSVTISHVSFAISPARSPAFADSRMIVLFRIGCRVVSA